MVKVLIAEDNILIADMLEDFLEVGGHEVCGTASTVDEAVMLANLHKPNVAIFDFRLGDGGFGSHIRPGLDDKNLGIIFATGDGMNNDLTTLDGDAYIAKPYLLNDVLEAVRIVNLLKTKIHVPLSSFPKNFHLLANIAERDVRKSA